MADSKETSSVTLGELKKIFKDYRVKVQEDDCERLFNFFASANTLNYVKLLKSLTVLLCYIVGKYEPAPQQCSGKGVLCFG